jgi:hypothetical protein
MEQKDPKIMIYTANFKLSLTFNSKTRTIKKKNPIIGYKNFDKCCGQKKKELNYEGDQKISALFSCLQEVCGTLTCCCTEPCEMTKQNTA